MVIFNGGYLWLDIVVSDFKSFKRYLI